MIFIVRIRNKYTLTQTQEICTYLMFTLVSKALCGQVIYGQSTIQICHSDQGKSDTQ